MYTKHDIWASFKKELDIIKHLAEKIPEGKEHHKPTEKQRTTLELLQYLSMMGVAMMRAVYEENTQLFAEYKEVSLGVTLENFHESMNKQEVEMKKTFDKFTDEEFNKQIERFGVTQSKALFILDLLKMMTAYKMQLFLYVKGSGNESIGTPNVWAGMDAQVPVK